jgi:hypothetical protein
MFFLILISSFVFIPHSAYAWGAGVHIGVALNIIEQLDVHTASIILANISEYLYGSLAPDFIIGKKYSSTARHSHNWDIGFNMLQSAGSEKNRAFAYGYLTHLAADSVAHSIMIPKLTKNNTHRNAKHLYLEMYADALCDKEYKILAKKILNRYNRKLDNQFKEKVDSVLFSFTVSKVLFKGMTKLSFNKKMSNIVMSEYFMDYFDVQIATIKSYIELSKVFSVDVLKKEKNSTVTNVNAISI